MGKNRSRKNLLRLTSEEGAASGGRESQGRAQDPGSQGLGNDCHAEGPIVAHGAAEILIQREEAVGFELPENPAQGLFDFVEHMKKLAAIQF